MISFFFFFFFQAEDGIRDVAVTGVQTCALPISYLFVSGDPAASSTASETKFSLAISSSPSACRAVSSRINFAISGSTAASGFSNESISSPWRWASGHTTTDGAKDVRAEHAELFFQKRNLGALREL